MTRRVLPPEDWPRLQGTELEGIWPHLDPATTTVIVVEDRGGAIIGAWAGFPLFHAEGVFIAEAHRGKAGVARLLLDGMRHVAKTAGYRSIVTASLDPTVGDMLTKLGATTIAGTHYALPLTVPALEKAG